MCVFSAPSRTTTSAAIAAATATILLQPLPLVAVVVSFVVSFPASNIIFADVVDVSAEVLVVTSSARRSRRGGRWRRRGHFA
jgi:hypothetical protein